jgi:hypothetical protein
MNDPVPQHGDQSGVEAGVWIGARFETFATVLAQASRIRCFEPLLIPGQLQTQAYARAVLASVFVPALPLATVERIIALRFVVQATLARRRPEQVYVIHQHALTPPLAAVMPDQIAHLGALAQAGTCIRVVGDVPHVGWVQPFIVADVPGPGGGVWLYRESLLGDTIVTSTDEPTVVAAPEAAFEAMVAVSRGF